MNEKRIKIILALTLTFIMSFTVVVNAFAGTVTEPVQVVNDEKVINDDVDLENPSTVVAVEVVSRDVEVLDPESNDYPVQKAADASLTINGNVSISKDDGSGYAETVGVSVNAIGEDSNARLVVNGDVTAHSATDAE